MSLEIIKSVLQHLNDSPNWSLQMLNIKTSTITGTGYSSREITLTPSNRLTQLLSDISKMYLDDNSKKSFNQYQEVRLYDGTADEFVIYKLPTNHHLLKNQYESLVETIANPDVESSPYIYKSAYLLKGQVKIRTDTISVKLVSMQNPITTLKNKFSLTNNGNFQELSDKVLNLRPTIDILIVNDTVYFFTLAGENLFNMSRSYKTVCHNKVEMIDSANIIHPMDNFKSVAESGHNPRKFVSFKDSNLDALKSTETRVRIAQKFEIPLDEQTFKFDTSTENACNKIVKFLCGKAMIDPINETAMEVSGAKSWQ